MKRILSVAGTLAALALASTAQAATINIGDNCNVSSQYFCISNGATPFQSPIEAAFGNRVTNGFDDTYTFTLPQTGTGSGGVQTNFVFGGGTVDFTSVIINGTEYIGQGTTIPGVGESILVSGISITGFVQNYIRVQGTGSGTYTGSATFVANPVPEPATWALMLAGFGAIGFAMRRNRKPHPQVRFAF